MCKTLVVDDDTNILSVISVMFDKINHPHVTTSSSTKALELIRKDPDESSILLTDLNIVGDMDGVILASKVRNINRKIICIAMTGYISEYPLDFCIRVGFKDTLIKPIGYQELIDVIEYYNKFRERLFQFL